MAAVLTQLVMPFAPATSYEAADFIPGEANRFAREMIARWPDWPYSLVLLHGPAGCGKTHLAHVFAAQSNAHFIDPKRIGSVPAERLLTGGHAWVIDGVEQVKDQPALAQLINHARARGDYVLFTARLPASRLPVALPDLASRLRALPTWDMGPPDDELLAAVLVKSFADRQLRIAPNVVGYAVTQLERSYEAAQDFAAKIDEASLAQGRAVTPALVRQLLQVKEA